MLYKLNSHYHCKYRSHLETQKCLNSLKKGEVNFTLTLCFTSSLRVKIFSVVICSVLVFRSISTVGNNTHLKVVIIIKAKQGGSDFRCSSHIRSTFPNPC